MHIGSRPIRPSYATMYPYFLIQNRVLAFDVADVGNFRIVRKLRVCSDSGVVSR